MFTNRSSVFFLVGSLAVFLGLMRPHEPVALTGLTILIWLGLQWFTVQLAVRSKTGLVDDVVRTVDGLQQDYFTLAVGQEYTVQLTGRILPGRRGFRLSVRDVLPEACQVVDGFTRLTIDKTNEDRFALVYKIKPRVCGRMELSGLMVAIEDPNRMFQGQRYLALRQDITVLPFLIRPQTTRSVLKTNNLQRVLGHHRHKSPGISSELLGIRDYQPGDPPRSIAWKPTARLGKLMSCEFESEVPVRATIFCDLSCYQFAGRPGTAVADSVITSVASVTRLLLSDRDPVAVILATENGSARMPHGHGERQLSRLMHYLLAAADPNPRLEYVSDDELVRIVFRESYRRFPELFERSVSFVPVGRHVLRPWRGKFWRKKCRMAPVLCEKLNLPPGHEFRLIHDPDAMRSACETWVSKYPVTTVRVHLPDQLHDQPLRAITNEHLCRRLMEARARAKDNELFVLVGCLPTAWDDAEQMLNAVRVCRAAGHRVIFIDAGLPDRALRITDPVARRLLQEANESEGTRVNSFVGQELTAMGVRWARIRDPKLMEKIAIEVELIRSGKVRGGASMRRNVAAGAGR